MQQATRISVCVIAVSKSHEFCLKVRRLSSFFRRRRLRIHVDESHFFHDDARDFDFDDESMFFSTTSDTTFYWMSRSQTLPIGLSQAERSQNMSYVVVCFFEKIERLNARVRFYFGTADEGATPVRLIALKWGQYSCLMFAEELFKKRRGVVSKAATLSAESGGLQPHLHAISYTYNRKVDSLPRLESASFVYKALKVESVRLLIRFFFWAAVWSCRVCVVQLWWSSGEDRRRRPAAMSPTSLQQNTALTGVWLDDAVHNL